MPVRHSNPTLTASQAVLVAAAGIHPKRVPFSDLPALAQSVEPFAASTIGSAIGQLARRGYLIQAKDGWMMSSAARAMASTFQPQTK